MEERSAVDKPGAAQPQPKTKASPQRRRGRRGFETMNKEVKPKALRIRRPGYTEVFRLAAEKAEIAEKTAACG